MFNEEKNYTEFDKGYWVKTKVYEKNKVIFDVFKEYIQDLITQKLIEFDKKIQLLKQEINMVDEDRKIFFDMFKSQIEDFINQKLISKDT